MVRHPLVSSAAGLSGDNSSWGQATKNQLSELKTVKSVKLKAMECKLIDYCIVYCLINGVHLKPIAKSRLQALESNISHQTSLSL